MKTNETVVLYPQCNLVVVKWQWGAMSYRGTGFYTPLKSNCNKDGYLDILSNSAMNCNRNWPMNGVRFCQKVATTNTKYAQPNTGSYTAQRRIHKILTFCATDIPILINYSILKNNFKIKLKYFNLLNFLLTVVYRKKTYLGLSWNITINFTEKRKVSNFS